MLKERFAVPITARTTWYRGNTHAQTRESDGDSSPEDVAAWYKNHGYDFLVLSDHNVFTDPAVLSHLVGDDFLLIPGEEVTSNYESAPVHVNGLNLPGLVDPRTGSTMVATIQNNVDAIREVEGVPSHQPPQLRVGFRCRGARAGGERQTPRDPQRPSDRPQRRWRRLLIGRGDLGHPSDGREAHLRHRRRRCAPLPGRVLG